MVGFGQVAKLQEIREFMLRGKEIAKKHYRVFSNYFTTDDLPAPMTWDHEVENETSAPFSDKLRMHHVNMIIASGIGYYVASMGACQRRDIIADYARLTAEAGKYAEDGMNIMINHEWCERPPHAADRDELMR
ncbi:DUF3231 family protein [Neobacillus sp. LXY-4]|uniref:DUF3231 family protein n=1 Tax=Neobacillus sp. LXY-4 TaxID=3379826 RepID=UPI003EE1B2DA